MKQFWLATTALLLVGSPVVADDAHDSSAFVERTVSAALEVFSISSDASSINRESEGIVSAA